MFSELTPAPEGNTRTFIYSPRSGSKLLAHAPGRWGTLEQLANRSYIATGGVCLRWYTATPRAYWRHQARDTLNALVAQWGGVAWDVEGLVGWQGEASRARAVLAAMAATRRAAAPRAVEPAAEWLAQEVALLGSMAANPEYLARAAEQTAREEAIRVARIEAERAEAERAEAAAAVAAARPRRPAPAEKCGLCPACKASDPCPWAESLDWDAAATLAAGDSLAEEWVARVRPMGLPVGKAIRQASGCEEFVARATEILARAGG